MGGQIGLEEDLAEAARIKEEEEEEKDGKRKTRNRSEEIDAKEKLKRHYRLKDKLAPLFDDPGQSIDNCYIRLALLTQQRFQQQKNENDNEEEEEAKYKESETWTNTLDYSLIYGNKMETLEVQDIWKDKENGLVVRHISICGEAGSGKSVLSQRIAYLWANDQMWNDQFQYLLHIPLRKIANIFDRHYGNDDEKMNDGNEDIEYLWSMIMNELHIPRWNANDTNCVIHSINGLLLLLDGFDEIANEIEKSSCLKQWLQHCTSNENYCVIITSRPNAMCQYLYHPRMLNVIGFKTQDIRNYIRAYFRNMDIDDKDNSQSDSLIKKLNNNPSLKLLSHTPLYLRLFCYLARQDKSSSSNNDQWDDMTLAKLKYAKWRND
ncbi:hypothetical protein RFI_04589, partial [Reticulomyxa filosa]